MAVPPLRGVLRPLAHIALRENSDDLIEILWNVNLLLRRAGLSVEKIVSSDDGLGRSTGTNRGKLRCRILKRRWSYISVRLVYWLDNVAQSC